MMGSIGAYGNPIFGIVSIPITGFHIVHDHGMTIRRVLAENFSKLRAASPSMSRPKDIVDAGAATNGTIGRISKEQSGLTLDKLEILANAYGLEPWQMLMPTLQAKPGKNGVPVVSVLPDWPWTMFDQSDYELIGDDYKKRIENELYGEIHRVKKLHAPDGTNGR